MDFVPVVTATDFVKLLNLDQINFAGRCQRLHLGEPFFKIITEIVCQGLPFN